MTDKQTPTKKEIFTDAFHAGKAKMVCEVDSPEFERRTMKEVENHISSSGDITGVNAHVGVVGGLLGRIAGLATLVGINGDSSFCNADPASPPNPGQLPSEAPSSKKER